MPFLKGSTQIGLMPIPNLRIEVDSWPVNDYRVIDRDLEFRTLNPNGRPFPDQRSIWKRLTSEELMLHFRFETVVAHWFLEKTSEAKERWLKAP